MDLTRVIAVIGVVAIHVFGAMVTNPQIRGGVNWWSAVIVDIGFVWTVPVFVMLSGALILEPRQYAAGTAAFYRRRLIRLAPALVFWSVFYFVIVRTVISQVPISREAVVSFFLDGRPYTHLYFLWLIVGLYAVAPVLAGFLGQGSDRRALWFAGIVMAATVVTASSSSLLGALGTARPLTLMALTQWIPYVGFFVAGWALRDVVLRGWRLGAVIAGTAIALAVTILQYGLRPQWSVLDAVAPVSYFGPIVAAVAVGVFVSATGVLAAWVPRGGWAAGLRELSDASFGVFLVHFVVMILLREVPLFAHTAASFGWSVLLWITTVTVSFAIVIVMRRIPWVARLV